MDDPDLGDRDPPGGPVVDGPDPWKVSTSEVVTFWLWVAALYLGSGLLILHGLRLAVGWP